MTIRYVYKFGQRTRKRVWLIGENNPYGHDPQYALYPSPPGCAGARLCRILGMTEDEYLATFERRNLLQLWGDKWSVPKAREAADAIRREVGGGAALILCGARVTKAFGYPFDLTLTPFTHGVDGTRVLVIPHPSGLSRAWNDPQMQARVMEAVFELVGGYPGS